MKTAIIQKQEKMIQPNKHKLIPDDLIIMISGVPGVGKTTISYELLKRFNVFRIIEETDIMREILRGYNDYLEEKNIDNRELIVIPKIPDHNIVLTFEMASQQSVLMKRSIENVITRQKRRKIPSIINGVHIVPEILRGINQDDKILYVNLYINDKKELTRRLMKRDPESYLLNHITDIYQANVKLNNSTINLVKKYGFINIHSLDVTKLSKSKIVNSIIDLIIRLYNT